MGLTVTDSRGASSSTSEQVVVHSLPVAGFDISPNHPLAGAAVSFDAGTSADPESGVRLASYVWRFGDGANGSGSGPGHTYAAPGTYTVALTVTNSLGLSQTASQAVTVVAPPHADFALTTQRPANGQALRFASSSADPAAAIYRWTFGDRSAPASGASPSHVFRSPGSYAVTLTVTDAFGHTASATHRITVALAGKVTRVSLASRGMELVVGLNAPGVLKGEGRTLKVKRAGTVALPLRLTAAQRRKLAATHTLTLHVVLRFAPAAGSRQTQTVLVVFRPAHAAIARLKHP